MWFKQRKTRKTSGRLNIQSEWEWDVFTIRFYSGGIPFPWSHCGTNRPSLSLAEGSEKKKGGGGGGGNGASLHSAMSDSAGIRGVEIPRMRWTCCIVLNWSRLRTGPYLYFLVSLFVSPSTHLGWLCLCLAVDHNQMSMAFRMMRTTVVSDVVSLLVKLGYTQKSVWM